MDGFTNIVEKVETAVYETDIIILATVTLSSVNALQLVKSEIHCFLKSLTLYHTILTFNDLQKEVFLKRNVE